MWAKSSTLYGEALSEVIFVVEQLKLLGKI